MRFVRISLEIYKEKLRYLNEQNSKECQIYDASKWCKVLEKSLSSSEIMKHYEEWYSRILSLIYN